MKDFADEIGYAIMPAPLFCRNCGNALPADSGFCSRCGASVSPSTAPGTGSSRPYPSTSPTGRSQGRITGIMLGLVAALGIVCAVAAQVSHSDLFEGAGLSGTYIASSLKTMPSLAPEVVFNRDASFLLRTGEPSGETITHGTYKINGNGSTLSFTPEGTSPHTSNDVISQALTEEFTTGTLTSDKNSFTMYGTDFEKWTDDADTTASPASNPATVPASGTPSDTLFPPSAPAVRLSDSLILTANNFTLDGRPGWYTSAFHLGRQTSLTLTLSAQSSCQADITTAANLERFKTNKAFDGFCAVTNTTGPKSCTLSAGDYYFVVRNSDDAPNSVSFQISY